MAGTGVLSGAPSFRNPANVIGKQPGDERLEISRDEFFQLMIAELQSQDPLEPMDNQQMMSQLAQLEELNTSQKMGDGIEELTQALHFGRLNDSASMLGKVVVGTAREQAVDKNGEPLFNDDGEAVMQDVEVEGLAERVVVQDGETNLVLLSPITDAEGKAVTDSQGNIITREVIVPAKTVSQILDPLIGSAPFTEGEGEGGESV